ncbi:META domain-containing protein [Corynebacterium suranareeae]|nr:META domain-containing protein [Corynebacterium suranareeae]
MRNQSLKYVRVLLVGAMCPLLASTVLGCSSTSDAPTFEGTWGSSEPPQPELTLAEDGSISGTDGCNRLIGSWELVDQHVELSPLGSTMMFCEGVDAWLGSATRAEIEGDSLHLFDQDGTEIGTLSKQD